MSAAEELNLSIILRLMDGSIENIVLILRTNMVLMGAE